MIHVALALVRQRNERIRLNMRAEQMSPVKYDAVAPRPSSLAVLLRVLRLKWQMRHI